MQNLTVPRRHATLRAIIGTYLRAAWRLRGTALLVLACYALGMLAQDIALPFFYRDIVDVISLSGAKSDAWPALRQILVSMILLIIGYNVCFRIADFSIAYLESNVMRDLTNDALERLQRHSYSFFVGNYTGSLVARVKRFVRAFETLCDRFIFDIWFTSIQLIGILGVLAVLLPPLAIFFTLWCIAYIGMSMLFVRYRLRFDFLEAEADSAVTGQLSDIITNILNLKIFTSSKREMQRFGRTTNDEYRARKRAWYLGNTLYASQAAAMSILEIAGMYITLRLWMHGNISTGTVVLVQAYLSAVMKKLWNVGRALSQIFKALSDAEEMVSILEQPLEVRDSPNPERSRIRRGTVAFDDVSFRYGGGNDVFKNFSLTIPAGQRVGIVGQSGAGKSTIFKLILRFLDVSDGAIKIDDQDLRSITQDDLRSAISYVPQDPILFHRSLYENIAYAKSGSTEEEVIAAAKRAHAHDFISGLPKGYQTLVGERGVKLSGGERQRVALARVILKDAPILLLDEATSSLDSVSERYIQEQLAELMQGRTTLAIAHRISTITRMDRIVVIHAGAIAEDGTHQELLAKCGLYADLWAHQSQGFLIDDDEAKETEDDSAIADRAA